MRKQLYFNPSTETKKAYLTRAAALLDIIRNHPGLIGSHPLLTGMTDAEMKEFENYLCSIIRPDVEKAAYLAARRSEILDYKDVIKNIALVSVMEILHTYNSPSSVTVPGGLSFDAFIGNTIKSSVREAFMEKTGLKKHQLDKANRVRKAIHYVAMNKQKALDDVTVDEIFQAQEEVSKAKPMSIPSIKEVLEYMETEVHYDGIEDFEMESKSNPFKSLENEETRAALHEMFLGMREAQRYIFLKRFLSGEDRTTYKQLAKETKLIELCKNDEVCMRNLTRGTLRIKRPKGDMPQIEEVYADILYVKVDFLDYMYRDALAKFKKFVIENSLFANDFEGWLNDWIHEEMENL